MKKVDLSDQAFKSVGITFNHVQYKLFHGDENDNLELQLAFPQYFEADKVEEPIQELEVEHEIEVEEQNTEERVQNQGVSEELIEDDGSKEDTDSWHAETVKYDPYNPSEEQQAIIDRYRNMIDPEQEVIDMDESEVIEILTPDEVDALLANVTEEVNAEIDNSGFPSGIIGLQVFDKNLSRDEISEVLNPTEELEVEVPEVSEAQDVPMGHKVPTILPSEPSKIEIFFKSLIDSGAKVVNNTLEFVMSLRFITMTAMIMIAVSAIYFDIDGWRETYHRLGSTQVTFIIVSLYVAKMAIIKILSVGVDKESLTGDWTDKIAFYMNHYMLRSVMIASLLGMIMVSSAGIYSSLAVNTVGDVKEVASGDSKILFIDKRIQSVDGRVLLVREQIKNMETAIKDLPEEQVSKRRKMLGQVNTLNDKIFELQNDKNKIEAEKEQAMIALNDKQTGNTNKALNFTAELLGVSLLELLKFINLLMTFVLEITYLSLTWLVVRLDKYSIRKS